MNRFHRALIALIAATSVSACAHQATVAPTAQGESPLNITTAADRGTMKGGDDRFTGEALIAMLFTPNGTREFSGATVTFQPGARTAWHSHPAGQTLVVTEGSGWVQLDGASRRDMGPGDVVWIPPGVRHWHGATASSAMTHVALQSQRDGAVVNWFEPVSDAQYLGEAGK